MIPAFKQASRRVDPGGNKPRRSATALPRLRFGITVRVGALATVAERPGQLVRVATNLKLLLGNLADEGAAQHPVAAVGQPPSMQHVYQPRGPGDRGLVPRLDGQKSGRLVFPAGLNAHSPDGDIANARRPSQSGAVAEHPAKSAQITRIA